MIASLECCCSEFGMFQFQYYLHRFLTELALACGSASISNTFSKTPKEAARFTDVVVFQPPFD
jgi:hypothetical protein